MKMRSTVLHAIGGGWGDETSSVSTSRVAVIRGADFPAVVVGDTRGLPRRWEKDSKLPQRLLLPEDIVLEISGGTSDRPTGRSVFISQRLSFHLLYICLSADSWYRHLRTFPADHRLSVARLG